MSFTTVKTHNVHKLGGISQVSVATWLGHEEQIFNDHVIANLLVPKPPPPLNSAAVVAKVYGLLF